MTTTTSTREPSAPTGPPGRRVGIIGTGSYLPAQILTNEVLAHRLNVDLDWIEDRTGVVERRVAEPEDATSDLATRAARRALRAAGITPADVGLIIVATSTPDLPLPASACQVQANLGAGNAYAMDVDAVCTGFVFALDVAQKIMRCDPGLGHALVIGADTYSRILDYSDRRTSALFGDGAGAVVLGRGPGAARIDYSRMGSDGTMNDYVQIPAGGSRNPIDCDGVQSGQQYFKMKGGLVRAFVNERLPLMVNDVTDATGLTVGEIDLLVPHQANVRMLQEATKEMGFVPDQVGITGDYYGNTGAASVPITLDAQVRSGRVRPGDRVLLAAFGGGMTWGTTLLTWPGPRTPYSTDREAFPV
jgi:3-oxoacyl-(acyl-carrier-protein) synthase III